jgi:hypothetical protein
MSKHDVTSILTLAAIGGGLYLLYQIVSNASANAATPQENAQSAASTLSANMAAMFPG